MIRVIDYIIGDEVSKVAIELETDDTSVIEASAEKLSKEHKALLKTAHAATVAKLKEFDQDKDLSELQVVRVR